MSPEHNWIETSRPCKLGTKPALVHIRAKSRVELGNWISVQDGFGAKWFKVLVTRVDPDGYFMADK